MPTPFPNTTNDMPPVVIVHGLWMNRAVMLPLAWRLRRMGLRCFLFGYRSRQPAQQICQQLEHWLSEKQLQQPHFIGHSLGGLVINHHLQCHQAQPGQRVVLLASPVNGSRVAQRLARFPPGRWMMGAAFEDSLNHGAQPWAFPPETLMLAATRPFGPGLLIPGGLEKPHDGTVNLAETQHPRLSDHQCIPSSHLWMLADRRTAERSAAFLQRKI